MAMELIETPNGKDKVLTGEETFYFPIKTPLTEKELLAYADEITECDTKLSELQGELELKKVEFKTKIGDVNLRASELMNLLKTKEEYKDIECFEDFNWFDGVVETKRVDNEKVVKTRKITAKEYQQNLPIKGAGNGADDSDDE